VATPVGAGVGGGGVLSRWGPWGKRRPLQVAALTAAASAVGGGVRGGGGRSLWRNWGRRYPLSVAGLRPAA